MTATPRLSRATDDAVGVVRVGTNRRISLLTDPRHELECFRSPPPFLAQPESAAGRRPNPSEAVADECVRWLRRLGEVDLRELWRGGRVRSQAFVSREQERAVRPRDSVMHRQHSFGFLIKHEPGEPGVCTTGAIVNPVATCPGNPRQGISIELAIVPIRFRF